MSFFSSRERNVSKVHLSKMSDLERQALEVQQSQLGDLRGLVGLGPGRQDVKAGLEAQNNLAAFLSQLQQTGGLPGQEDITAAQTYAGQIFAPQRVAMQQAFQEQGQQQAQLAARLGRRVNDPILQAKLAQSQTQQSAMLEAQQGAFAAEQARNLPLQRLQFASQLAQLRGGLATQALQNRLTLAGLGSQFAQQQQQFRVNTATRENIAQKTPSAFDQITGVLGAGFGIAGGIQNMMGGASTPGTNEFSQGQIQAGANDYASKLRGATSTVNNVASAVNNVAGAVNKLSTGRTQGGVNPYYPQPSMSGYQGAPAHSNMNYSFPLSFVPPVFKGFDFTSPVGSDGIPEMLRRPRGY